MSKADWLSRRAPEPPAEVASAIRDALEARNITSDAPSPTELLETAQWLLEKVLQTECDTRDSALTLLTADALVTYALEVANDSTGQLGDFPERAMKTLATQGNSTTQRPRSGTGDPSNES